MLTQTLQDIITEINIERNKSKDSVKTTHSSHNSSHYTQFLYDINNQDQSTKSTSPDGQRSCSRNQIYKRRTHCGQNSKTYRKKWTTKEQELLCNLIGRYGSDFTFLQTQFPTKTRKQLKKKYQEIHKSKHYLHKIQKIEEFILRQRRKSVFDEQVMDVQFVCEKKKEEQNYRMDSVYNDLQSQSQRI